MSAGMFLISYSEGSLSSVLSGAAWDIVGNPRLAFLPIAISALPLLFAPAALRFHASLGFSSGDVIRIETTDQTQLGTQMADLKLSFACWDYDRTRPLMDGRVKPEGIELDIHILRPRETFQRMLDNKEFRVSEMSLASYTALKGRGAVPVRRSAGSAVGIFSPFLHLRAPGAPGLRHRRTCAASASAPRNGAQLRSSSCVACCRTIMDVKSEDMRWFMGGLNSFVEPPLIALDLPSRFKLDFLAAGQSLEQMFAAGELDALLSIYMPKLFVDGSPAIARLFPNYKKVEQDYYRRTRIFPIMHTVVLREDVYRAHPWAARSIYEALIKRGYCSRRALRFDALRVALPWLLDHVEETRRVFGHDYWAYGLEANRPTYEAIGSSFRAGAFTPRRSADELFAPVE